MGRIILDVTTSLDGFAAGSNVRIADPMGIGGDHLHDWMKGEPGTVDRELADGMFTGIGSIIIGRRTFDVGEGPWGEDGTFGMPCFVLTHRTRDRVVKGPTSFTFVTEGLAPAIESARTAAGQNDVLIMGPAVARQCLAAAMLDEIRLHLSPTLLGSGVRLFDDNSGIALDCTQVVQGTRAVHLTYRTKT